MNKDQFAQLLNGRQYRSEMTEAEEMQAAVNDFLVVFGASDDLLEFRGWINDEVGAWKGTTVSISEFGFINSKHVTSSFNVKAEWCPKHTDASWVITADVPYTSFAIMEDEEIFCHGIVIDIKEVNFTKLDARYEKAFDLLNEIVYESGKDIEEVDEEWRQKQIKKMLEL